MTKTKGTASDGWGVGQVLARLEALGDAKDVAGKARFGITSTARILGVKKPMLREVAREIRRTTDAAMRHKLAAELWDAPVHEARNLAVFLEEPSLTSARQLDKWVQDFDTWELTDDASTQLLWRTPGAVGHAQRWLRKEGEFQRRAGLATLMACAWKGKDDDAARLLISLTEPVAVDGRKYVHKAVVWALVQLARSRPSMADESIACAHRLALSEDAAARRAGKATLAELRRRGLLPQDGSHE